MWSLVNKLPTGIFVKENQVEKFSEYTLWQIQPPLICMVVRGSDSGRNNILLRLINLCHVVFCFVGGPDGAVKSTQYGRGRTSTGWFPGSLPLYFCPAKCKQVSINMTFPFLYTGMPQIAVCHRINCEPNNSKRNKCAFLKAWHLSPWQIN